MVHPIRLAGMIRTHFSYDVGPATAFIGPNGTGKSSALAAITLPFEGKRYGGGSIDALIPPDSDHAASTISCSDGTSYGFDSRVDPFTPPPATAPIVIRPASRLVMLGKARVLEEVVSRWGGSEVALMLNAPDTLTEVQKQLWIETIASIRTAIEEKKAKKPKRRRGATFADDGMSGIDDGRISWGVDSDEDDGDDGPTEDSDDPATLLSRIGKVMRSFKRKKSDEIKSLKAIVSPVENGAMAADPAGVPTMTAPVEDLPRLQMELSNAEAFERAEPYRRRHQKLLIDADAYTRSADAFNDRSTSIADRQPLAIEEQRLQSVLVAAEANLTFATNMCNAIGASAASCPCCGQAFDAATVHAAHLENWRNWNAQRDAVKAQHDQLLAKLTEIDEHGKWRDAERNRLEAQRQNLMRESQEISAGLANVPQSVSGTSVELRARVDAARLAQAIRNEKQKHIERIAVLEQEHSNIKAVEQAAEVALKRLTGVIMGRLNTEMQPFLPVEYRDRFHFDLIKGRFMMIGEDGRPHAWRDQSGAEFAALTLALARSEARGRPAILVLEYGSDLAEFDEAKRAQILDQLSLAAAHEKLFMVAVASPVPLPLGELWNIVHTGSRPQLHDDPKPSATPAPFPIQRARLVPMPHPSTLELPRLPLLSVAPTAPMPTIPLFAPTRLPDAPNIANAPINEAAANIAVESVAPTVTAEQVRAHRWSHDDPSLPTFVKEWIACYERNNVSEVAVALDPSSGWWGTVGDHVEHIATAPTPIYSPDFVSRAAELPNASDDDAAVDAVAWDGDEDEEDEGPSDDDTERVPPKSPRARKPKAKAAKPKTKANGHAKKPKSPKTVNARKPSTRALLDTASRPRPRK